MDGGTIYGGKLRGVIGCFILIHMRAWDLFAVHHLYCTFNVYIKFVKDEGYIQKHGKGN